MFDDQILKEFLFCREYKEKETVQRRCSHLQGSKADFIKKDNLNMGIFFFFVSTYKNHFFYPLKMRLSKKAPNPV